jgi:hypothetical protein
VSVRTLRSSCHPGRSEAKQAQWMDLLFSKKSLPG